MIHSSWHAGWHHKDTLAQMIGELSEDDVLMEEDKAMGAVTISASANLLVTIHANCLTLKLYWARLDIPVLIAKIYNIQFYAE